MTDGFEKYVKTLEELINSAFGEVFRKKSVKENSKPVIDAKYKTISEYTEVTGKRFRMTKDQKSRNLSREGAFHEFVQSLTDES